MCVCVCGCVRVCVCVCVLTGLRTDKYDRLMRWWSYNPQSGIAQVLDYVAYCDVILPRRPCYTSPHCSYQKNFIRPLGRPLSPSQHICLPHEVILPPGSLPSLSQYSNSPSYHLTSLWLLPHYALSKSTSPIILPQDS